MTIPRERAVAIAWRRGLLSYKLRTYQLPVYDSLWLAVKNPACLKFVLKCARRFGKSTILCLIALEFALRNPKAQIRFAAPTAKNLRKIVLPIMKMLLDDCPEGLRPKFMTMDNMFVFSNGAEIHLAGTDGGHAESLRGTASDLNIIDEAGFADELDYVVHSILIPQTLTTGGKTILASTPPKSPAHDFNTISQDAEARGWFVKFDIWANTSMNKLAVDAYAEACGGYTSTTFRREALCEDVVDEELAIVPDWNDKYCMDYEEGDILQRYYHSYVAMDLGVRDKTAALFATYNFTDAKIYVHDEMEMSGHTMTTDVLSDRIKEKEAEVFGTKKPYRRVADNNNLLLIQDLTSIHGLSFVATSKDNLHAMVNELRLWVRTGRVVVSPRCKMLLGCLRYGIFKDNRTEFARSKVFGHFDHLAALIYLIRNIDQHSNPIPVSINWNSSTFLSGDAAKKVSANGRTLEKLVRVG